MATVYNYGYFVTQNTDYNVVVSRKGRPVMKFEFSRQLTGDELSELAFIVLTR